MGAATSHFIRLALLVPLLACAPNWSHAALFERDWKMPGDGLLTYDTLNQREWLDLTETQLFNFPGDTIQQQFAAVLEQTNPGGVFEGFRVATSGDVYGLAESGGINASTTDFATNRMAADLLTELIGDTRAGLPNKTSAGLGGDLMPLVVAYGPAAREIAYAGILTGTRPNSDNGVWLYRPVPEPSSGMQVAVMSFILLVAGVYFRR